MVIVGDTTVTACYNAVAVGKQAMAKMVNSAFSNIECDRLKRSSSSPFDRGLIDKNREKRIPNFYYFDIYCIHQQKKNRQRFKAVYGIRDSPVPSPFH